MAAFSLAIGKFCERAKGNAELVFRKVSIDMLSRVILRSPVDTGRFRANWQVGLAAVGFRLEEEDPSGSKTIAMGTMRIEGIKLGGAVWISNSLPYALRLENGWSTQAPSGMVKVTIAEYQRLVSRAAAEVS